jgi:hypothetical protein
MDVPIVTGGAYGLQISGLVSPALLSPAPPDWTQVVLERRPVDDAPRRMGRGRDVHELVFANGWALRMERREPRATFFVPKHLPDEDLVHPYLAWPAMTFAGWLGRAAFHAGAFVNGRGAWAVVAPREGGKSTTLAALAARGVPVLTDDVLVVSSAEAFAGPRCIDLRGDAPALAGAAHVRGGERRRVALPPVPAIVPLCGFVVLSWGESVEVEDLRPSERLLALAAHTLRETAPREVLELTKLPVRRLVRPRRLDALGSACERLLDATAD